MSHPSPHADPPAADTAPMPPTELAYAGQPRVAGWLRLVCLAGAIWAAVPRRW